jgi:hypothetical protein
MLLEMSIGGVLVSALLPYGVATIPVFWLVDKLLQRVGCYRCFWHPALVRLARESGFGGRRHDSFRVEPIWRRGS